MIVIIDIIIIIKGIAKISKKSFIDDKLWKRSYIYDNLFIARVVPEIYELTIAVILLCARYIMFCINGLLPYVWFISCNLDNPMLISCGIVNIDTNAVVSIKYWPISMSIKNKNIKIMVFINPDILFSFLIVLLILYFYKIDKLIILGSTGFTR